MARFYWGEECVRCCALVSKRAARIKHHMRKDGSMEKMYYCRHCLHQDELWVGGDRYTYSYQGTWVRNLKES